MSFYKSINLPPAKLVTIKFIFDTVKSSETLVSRYFTSSHIIPAILLFIVYIPTLLITRI